jgi:hypothetical protein
MEKSFVMIAAAIGTITVLAIGSAAEAKTIEQDEVLLFNCGAVGQAKRRVRVQDDGRRDLRIQVSDAVPGEYAVEIDERFEGVITVGNVGQGEIEFDDEPGPGELPLGSIGINPWGEIAIRLGSCLAFSLTDSAACEESNCFVTTTTTTTSTTTSTSTSTSTTTTTTSTTTSTTTGQTTTTTMTPTTSTTTTTTTPSTTTTTTTMGGSGSCDTRENNMSLLRCAAGKRTTADRRVRVREDCDRDLRVRIAGVPKGAYSVFIDRVDVATLTVSGSKAEIEFDDTPAVNEVFLGTIDPFGEIDIVRDSDRTLMFSLSPGCEID